MPRRIRGPRSSGFKGTEEFRETEERGRSTTGEKSEVIVTNAEEIGPTPIGPTPFGPTP